MGKLLVTNNTNWDNSLRKIFMDSGFIQKGRNHNQAYLTTYRKLNVDNENYYSTENDYIASAGTIIYEGLTGCDALKKLLEDFDGNNIRQIRSQAVGCFLLVIKKFNTIYAFVDEAGTYGAYYHHDGTNYILTTTYYHIAKCINPLLYPGPFLEQVFTGCIMDENTIFHNIYRIMGSECIFIELDSAQFTVKKVEVNKYTLGVNEINEQIKKFIDKCTSYCEKKKLFEDSPMLFATGGTDSRLMLAMDIYSGLRPIVALWHGDPVDVQTFDEDLKLGKQLASIGNLETEIYDISRDLLSELDEENIDKLEKYGEYSIIYGGNPSFFKIFENGDVKHADSGYYGELLKKLDEFAEFDITPEYTLTLDEFVSKHVNRWEIHVNRDDGCDIKDVLIAHMIEELRKLSDEAGIDYKNLKQKDCLDFYKFRRMHSDSKFCNFVNIFGYSYEVLAQKEIADYSSQFHYELRNRKYLHLKMIQTMCPELLNVDFFTHCQRERFDKNSMTLNEIKTANVGGKIRHVLKPFFMKTKMGEKLVYWYRHNAAEGKVHNEIIRKYVKKIKETGVTDMIGMNVTENSFIQMPAYRDVYRHCVLVKHILKVEKDMNRIKNK